MVSETKLDDAFPTSQFLMWGYSIPFRKDLTEGSYNLHKNNIGTHLKNIGKTLDKLSGSYDNIILLGDFNIEPEEAKLS